MSRDLVYTQGEEKVVQIFPFPIVFQDPILSLRDPRLEPV